MLILHVAHGSLMKRCFRSLKNIWLLQEKLQQNMACARETPRVRVLKREVESYGSDTTQLGWTGTRQRDLIGNRPSSVRRRPGHERSRGLYARALVRRRRERDPASKPQRSDGTCRTCVAALCLMQRKKIMEANDLYCLIDI